MSDWTDLLYRSLYGPPSQSASARNGGAAPWGLHDYLMPGMPTHWDWYRGARGGLWNDTRAGQACAVNGLIGHISGSLNYKVEVRNMEVWIRANGSWTRRYTTAGADAQRIFGSYYRSSNYSHAGSITEEVGTDNACRFPMREFTWSHFYCKGGGPRVEIPSGFERLHVRGQFRLVGAAASTALVMGRVSSDYFSSVTQSAPSQDVQPAVASARMLRVTQDWRWYTMTTLEPNLITGSLAPPAPSGFSQTIPDVPDAGEPPVIPPDQAPVTPDLPNGPSLDDDGELIASEFSPYDLSERSVQLAAPIELYEFQAGNTFWRYTSAEADVDYLSQPYLSRAISRTPVAVTEEQSRNAMTITAPRNLDIAEQFRITPPTAVVSLVVRRVDRISGDGAVVWSGRLLNVGWRGSSVELQCEPSSFSLDRNGLRRVWGPQCPHVLYGTKCKVDRFAFRTITVVTAVSGRTVTVAELGAFPHAGGFIVRVGQYQELVSHLHYIRSATGLTLEVSGRANYFQVGDGVEVFPGCNHTTAVCSGTYNNILNYGGQPYFPGNNPFEGDQVY